MVAHFAYFVKLCCASKPTCAERRHFVKIHVHAAANASNIASHPFLYRAFRPDALG